MTVFHPESHLLEMLAQVAFHPQLNYLHLKGEIEEIYFGRSR